MLNEYYAVLGVLSFKMQCCSSCVLLHFHHHPSPPPTLILNTYIFCRPILNFNSKLSDLFGCSCESRGYHHVCIIHFKPSTIAHLNQYLSPSKGHINCIYRYGWALWIGIHLLVEMRKKISVSLPLDHPLIVVVGKRTVANLLRFMSSVVGQH